MEDSFSTLSEGIELYSQGIEITRKCLEILNDGKERIKELQAQMTALFEGDAKDDESHPV